MQHLTSTSIIQADGIISGTLKLIGSLLHISRAFTMLLDTIFLIFQILTSHKCYVPIDAEPAAGSNAGENLTAGSAPSEDVSTTAVPPPTTGNYCYFN